MDSRLSARDAVERFHLVFLRALASGANKNRFVVKGGCNVRFFFGSPRYSEDLDLDVAVGASGTLRKNVEKVLESSSVVLPLRSTGIQIARVSAPKQTETTQRWKVQLAVAGLGAPLSTKVEFSRRLKPRGFTLEAIRPEVLAHHRLPLTLACHYEAEHAFSQKIDALILRTEVQARDVFDLGILLDALGGQAPKVANAQRHAATERALGITYGEYRAQVVAFLPDLERATYDSPEAWESLQLRLVQALEESGG